MINANMRSYDYYKLGGKNSYGQETIGEKQGTIMLSIVTTSQSVQQNALYYNANYIALTLDSTIDDTYLIRYGDLTLKVLYIQPNGRYKQVFLSVYE